MIHIDYSFIIQKCNYHELKYSWRLSWK